MIGYCYLDRRFCGRSEPPLPGGFQGCLLQGLWTANDSGVRDLAFIVHGELDLDVTFKVVLLRLFGVQSKLLLHDQQVCRRLGQTSFAGQQRAVVSKALVVQLEVNQYFGQARLPVWCRRPSVDESHGRVRQERAIGCEHPNIGNLAVLVGCDFE